jgi:hypothetical protein
MIAGPAQRIGCARKKGGAAFADGLRHPIGTSSEHGKAAQVPLHVRLTECARLLAVCPELHIPDYRHAAHYRTPGVKLTPACLSSTELQAGGTSLVSRPNLVLENLFYLSDLLLDFSGVFFSVAFGL